MVSVVIPYSSEYESLLTEAVASVKQQTIPCELILSRYDDKPFNLPAARNRGIERAQGEFIIPLDADDKLQPTFAERVVAAHKEGIGIVATGMETFGDYYSKHMPSESLTFQELLHANQLYCTSMFPKKVWQAVGGYDETMVEGYEDWDFWLRILKHYKLAVVPEFLFLYRKHGPSMIDRTVIHHKRLHNYIKAKHT